MVDAQIISCIEAGLGHKPTDSEITEWGYGAVGRKTTRNEQLAFLESAFEGSNSEWRLKVLSLIQQIEPGQLISYGNLARWANKEYGLKIGPRNAAWLRKQIYWKIGHDSDIPLHRVANDGDLKSSRDHPVTQHINKHKRSAEGSLYNPVWVRK